MRFRLNLLIRVVLAIGPAFVSSCFDLDPYASDDRAGNVGAIGFNLTLPGDMQHEDLAYTVLGIGTYQKVGTIPFSALSRSFSATIKDIPVGKGYQLQLTSGSDDSKVHCMGSAAFDILMPRVTTHIAVKLQCHRSKDDGPGPSPDPDQDLDAGTGGVDVEGDTNLCPEIDGIYTWKEADGSFELSSSACDMDSLPAPLRYEWSVSAGSLSSTKDEVVRFICPQGGGTVRVTLEVSDSLCSDAKVAAIDCDCDDDRTPMDGRHSKRM